MSDLCHDAGLAAPLPSWVPAEARTYLVHTERGTPIRALARAAGVHASTVLRQVRSLEARREDVLVDHALNRLGACVSAAPGREQGVDIARAGNADARAAELSCAEALGLPTDELNAEAQRILLRLCEPGSLLAVALEMDKAVVVKEIEGGDTVRRAAVSRDVAEAMALNAWIESTTPGGTGGRISRYRITAAGRGMLKSLLARAENRAAGFAAAQPGAGETPDREARRPDTMGEREPRYQSIEPPLTLLARRRDQAGAPYLPVPLVRVGERLREDFEMAGLTERADTPWDQFLTEADEMRALSPASKAARSRVVGALRDLGVGLGEAALHCCCYLEGLEKIEQRFGWSARSGKVVLRIALQRLRRYYDALGDAGAMIG